MPDHETYVEPFAGGLSILLNKPTTETEVAGDLNAGLIRAWQAIQWKGFALQHRLLGIPYDLASFEAAEPGAADELEHAAAYLVRSRMSRGGLGVSFSHSDRLRGGQREGANAWETTIAALPKVMERIAKVIFVNAQAIETIMTYGWNEDAVILCDPPYIHETRVVTDAYDWEMTTAEHGGLLDVLMSCPARVLLCGYDNPIYARRLARWNVKRWDIANHSGQSKTKQRRTECLWMNY